MFLALRKLFIYICSKTPTPRYYLIFYYGKTIQTVDKHMIMHKHQKTADDIDLQSKKLDCSKPNFCIMIFYYVHLYTVDHIV